MRTRSKLLMAAVGVDSVGATFVGVAVAADPTDSVEAPHAQAAGSVDRDGSVNQKTNTIEETKKVASGRYCVKLASSVSAAKAVPQATLSNSADWDSEIYVLRSHSTCDANSIYVTTGTEGKAKDQPFYLLIP